jgi:hypothetical protein
MESGVGTRRQRSSMAMVRKLAEESLHTVVFLSIWGGGARVGGWRERRRERIAAKSGKNEQSPPCVRQNMGTGPVYRARSVYWARPIFFFFIYMRKFAQVCNIPLNFWTVVWKYLSHQMNEN